MIAVITEQPNIGRDIARILGATRRYEGYNAGNGYVVTWTYGHLVSLAKISDYGVKRPKKENIPVVPDQFKYRLNSISNNDLSHKKQLKIVKELFSKCDSIIVATDMSGEGELIFRDIYNYLDCTKPFKRLWLHSLTDNAIREGLANLKDGSCHDNLYHSADCRAKADWLIGANASATISNLCGGYNHYIGRLEIPVLATICSRFVEQSVPIKDFWQLKMTLQKDDCFMPFSAMKNIANVRMANEKFEDIKAHSQARIVKVEHKTMSQNPPLLYNLVALQRDASTYFGFSLQLTLTILQGLYQRKIISYPKTDSRYISEEMLAKIPSLIERIKYPSELVFHALNFDANKLNTNSVDTSKSTTHHAIMLTGINPIFLHKDERIIFNMIAGRMLEAFSPAHEKEVCSLLASCEDMFFESEISTTKTMGWRELYNRKDNNDKSIVFKELPHFSAGEMIDIGSYNLVQKQILPNPLYTEATLWESIEKIGSVGTKTEIINNLLDNDYIEYHGKQIIPTRTAMSLYKLIGNKRIADMDLCISWEECLAKIEKDSLYHKTFMQAIEIFTRQVSNEILSIKTSKERVGETQSKDDKPIKERTQRCRKTKFH